MAGRVARHARQAALVLLLLRPRAERLVSGEGDGVRGGEQEGEQRRGEGDEQEGRGRRRRAAGEANACGDEWISAWGGANEWTFSHSQQKKNRRQPQEANALSV